MDNLMFKGELTPQFINFRLGPFLQSLSGMQHTIDELRQGTPAPVSIHQIGSDKSEARNAEEQESRFATFLDVARDEPRGYFLGKLADEDVVGLFIEKELKAGKTESEILEILNSPGLYRRLEKVKNDVFRWETAEQPVGSSTNDSVDKLSLLLEKAALSGVEIAVLELDRKGYSSEQIAHELGIDVDNVYIRRSAAMRKLAVASRTMPRSDKPAKKWRKHLQEVLQDLQDLLKTQNLEEARDE